MQKQVSISITKFLALILVTIFAASVISIAFSTQLSSLQPGIVREKGDKGSTGPQGPIGPIGPTGSTGATGLAGM